MEYQLILCFIHGIFFIHTLYKTMRFSIRPPLKNSLFAFLIWIIEKLPDSCFMNILGINFFPKISLQFHYCYLVREVWRQLMHCKKIHLPDYPQFKPSVRRKQTFFKGGLLLGHKQWIRDRFNFHYYGQFMARKVGVYH